MKNILRIFLSLLILSLSLSAIEENKIKDVMLNKINKITKLLKNKNVDNKKNRENKIIHLLEDVFDYKIMARISLGKKWKELSKEQREIFASAFEEKIKHSYIEKLNLYTNEKIEIKELKKIKKNRIKLKSVLIGDTQSFNIIYKFHLNKNKQWLIYDLTIIGVSVIQTYRKQFSSYLQNNTFEDLVKSL